MNVRRLNGNRGYSLVEMIIVIAIILTLAGVSLISLTLVNSARAKEASVTFGSEVNALKTKCMNMKPSGDEYTHYGMAIYQDDAGVYNLCLVKYNKTTGEYDYETDENVKLSSRVEIKLETPTTTSSSSKVTYFNDLGGSVSYDTPETKVNIGKKKASSGNKAVILLFDKKGYCYSGAGTYRFIKRNGTQMARVTISQNGSVDIR